jgi:glutamate-1-semialdehyde 2,1-aminomutase
MSVALEAKLEETRNFVVREYQRRTRSPLWLTKRLEPSCRGDTRTTTYFEPYPLYMERGIGCRLIDLDGSTYLDLLSNYTSMIHGHAHPHHGAVAEQLQKGTAFGSAIEAQTRLATELCERLPSLQSVRFCNSGTEATMSAIRAAKAFTGRAKILKMEGGYHGSHDAVEVSVSPSAELAGPAHAPHSVPGPGLFAGITGEVLVAPFNDTESTAKIIDRHAKDLAAVIVEPVQGAAGVIPATQEYMTFLREATARCGALLIFDEVVTIRLNYGGAQAMYGIRPDLTALGKIIGGGFPIGAFGGRKDIMAQYDPRARKLRQSGTYNGNAISMVAGLAAMQVLTSGEIERLNGLGDRLRSALNGVLGDFGIDAYVVGTGSLSQLRLFAPRTIRNYRDALPGSNAANAVNAAYELLHLALTSQGFFGASRGEYAISTPMTEVEIAHAVGSFRSALGESLTSSRPSASMSRRDVDEEFKDSHHLRCHRRGQYGAKERQGSRHS